MPNMDYKSVIASIQRRLREYLKVSGLKGFVLGLSGGLDSSVAAVLCRKASNSTVGLFLPCESNPQDMEDANLVAKKFDIKTKVYDLTSIHDVFLRTLEISKTDKEARRIAVANIKPRLRMVALYCVANILGYLVVGTSNRTELMLGYFTKYGDGGADILPLGDLLKRDVREIAQILNIPKRIIEKKPSAGLWSGQTDEGELGASYDILDRVVANEDVSDVNSKLINRLRKRMTIKKHKSLPPSICMIEDYIKT